MNRPATRRVISLPGNLLPPPRKAGQSWGGGNLPLALVAALSMLAASAGAVAQPAVQVVDDAGQSVRLTAPARRIVSIAPHLTELLFSAGAGDRVVGAVAFSDHPAAARRIPRIGDSAQLDLERIVSLRPDLIVYWLHGNSPQQVQRLRALGLPLFAGESRRLSGISGTLRRLGVLAGTEATASAQADAFDRQVAALRERYAGRAPVRVFYQIWHQPLLTVNGQHLISEVLRVCGADNVFAGLAPLTPNVSVESVLAADPDAIVTGSVDPAGPDNLDRWRKLRTLRAARLGNLVVVDPDKLHRQSERIVAGAHELCGRLDEVRARLAAAR